MPSFLILRRRTGEILRFVAFGGCGNDGVGPLKLEPFHKEEVSQSDANPACRGFRAQPCMVEQLHVACLPEEVTIGIVRRRTGY
jgi:hypothetical protein